MEPILLRASEESKNQRLDAFLASSLDGLTRSQATRLIESGEVAVNGSRPCRRTFRSTWCTRTRT